MNFQEGKRFNAWDTDDDVDEASGLDNEIFRHSSKSQLFFADKYENPSPSVMSKALEQKTLFPKQFGDYSRPSLFVQQMPYNHLQRHQIPLTSADGRSLALKNLDNSKSSVVLGNMDSTVEQEKHKSPNSSVQTSSLAYSSLCNEIGRDRFHRNWSSEEEDSISEKTEDEPELAARDHHGWMRGHSPSRKKLVGESSLKSRRTLPPGGSLNTGLRSGCDRALFQDDVSSFLNLQRQTSGTQRQRGPHAPSYHSLHQDHSDFHTPREQQRRQHPNLREMAFPSPYSQHNDHGTMTTHSMDPRDSGIDSISNSSYGFSNRICPKWENIPKKSDYLNHSFNTGLEKTIRTNEISNPRDHPRNNAQISQRRKKDTRRRTKDHSKTAKNTNNSSLISQPHAPNSFVFQNGGTFDIYHDETPTRQATDSAGHGEDFEEKLRRRKRNHVIFLLLVLFIVAAAVISAVLASTLGATSQGSPRDKGQPNLTAVRAIMTLKILNREFDAELLKSGSEAFVNLATPYSLELDELFLKSNLANVYSSNQILSFRNGSIYATSAITFADSGLIASPKDVENVIETAEAAPTWKNPNALQLGEFIVCKTCAETVIEYVPVKEMPNIMLHNMEHKPDHVTGGKDTGNYTTNSPATSPSDVSSALVSATTDKIISSASTAPSSVPHETTFKSTTLSSVPHETTSKTTTLSSVPHETTSKTTTLSSVPHETTSTSTALSSVPHETTSTSTTLSSVPHETTSTSTTLSSVPHETTSKTTTLSSVPHETTSTSTTLSSVPHETTSTSTTLSSVPHETTSTSTTLSSVPHETTSTSTTLSSVQHETTSKTTTLSSVPHETTSKTTTLSSVPHETTSKTTTLSSVPHETTSKSTTLSSVPHETTSKTTTLSSVPHETTSKSTTLSSVPHETTSKTTTPSYVPHVTTLETLSTAASAPSTSLQQGTTSKTPSTTETIVETTIQREATSKATIPSSVQGTTSETVSASTPSTPLPQATASKASSTTATTLETTLQHETTSRTSSTTAATPSISQEGRTTKTSNSAYSSTNTTPSILQPRTTLKASYSTFSSTATLTTSSALPQHTTSGSSDSTYSMTSTVSTTSTRQQRSTSKTSNSAFSSTSLSTIPLVLQQNETSTSLYTPTSTTPIDSSALPMHTTSESSTTSSTTPSDMQQEETTKTSYSMTLSTTAITTLLFSQQSTSRPSSYSTAPTNTITLEKGTTSKASYSTSSQKATDITDNSSPKSLSSTEVPHTVLTSTSAEVSTASGTGLTVEINMNRTTDAYSSTVPAVESTTVQSTSSAALSASTTAEAAMSSTTVSLATATSAATYAPTDARTQHCFTELTRAEESGLSGLIYQDLPEKFYDPCTTSSAQLFSFTTAPMNPPRPTSKTVIAVSNVFATATDSHATVTCFIESPNDWSAVNILHTPKAFSDSAAQRTQTIVRLDTRDLYVVATISAIYNNRVRVFYDVSSTHIDIKMNISNLGCLDDGYIECSLAGPSGSTTSSRGRLEVTVPPSAPRLTIPVEVVANREMVQPVTCEADVGYPAWDLTLTSLLPGSAVPQLLATYEENIVDGCKITKTLRVEAYTPTYSSNGTVLRCELHHKEETAGKGDVLADSAMLLVVGGSVCKGQPNGTALRHPYNCSSHILCSGQQPHVSSCPSNHCFDTVSGQCGVASVIVQSANGFLNKGLAGVSCSVIHMNNWSEIILRRYISQTASVDVLSVTADGSLTWHDLSLTSRAISNFRFTSMEAVLEIWIFVLKCADEGAYTCTVNGPTHLKDGHAVLKVYATPQSPVLNVPRAIVEGSNEKVKITCEANLGRPAAALILLRKLPNEAEFAEISFTDVPETRQDSCTPRVKRSYTTSASKELNGTMYKCEVSSYPGTPEQQRLTSDAKDFYVFPAKTCQDVGPTLLPHPRDCRYFVQCAQSEAMVLSCGTRLCFNSDTQQCDKLVQKPESHNCPPPQNGTFVPHPLLCDKYIRCEMGREIIQHCPEGQLYATNGVCSSNIHDSHCFTETFA